MSATRRGTRSPQAPTHENAPRLRLHWIIAALVALIIGGILVGTSSALRREFYVSTHRLPDRYTVLSWSLSGTGIPGAVVLTNHRGVPTTYELHVSVRSADGITRALPDLKAYVATGATASVSVADVVNSMPHGARLTVRLSDDQYVNFLA